MKNQDLEMVLPGSVWEDLVNDFLEMSCFLKQEEQEYLIRELQKQDPKVESIETHPCFSIEGRAIVVAEDVPLRECWLYLPKRQQIRKWVRI